MISVKVDPRAITLTSCWGQTKTVAEWMEAMEISKVYSLHGDWVVTPYGLECLTSYYAIAAHRLWEGDGVYPWECHVSEKTWVNMDDFYEGIEAARERHRRRASCQQYG